MNNEILYFLNLHHNLNFNTQQLEQDYKNANVFRYYGPKHYGFSVRCVTD